MFAAMEAAPGWGWGVALEEDGDTGIAIAYGVLWAIGVLMSFVSLLLITRSVFRC